MNMLSFAPEKLQKKIQLKKVRIHTEIASDRPTEHFFEIDLWRTTDFIDMFSTFLLCKKSLILLKHCGVAGQILSSEHAGVIEFVYWKTKRTSLPITLPETNSKCAWK